MQKEKKQTFQQLWDLKKKRGWGTTQWIFSLNLVEMNSYLQVLILQREGRVLQIYP